MHPIRLEITLQDIKLTGFSLSLSVCQVQSVPKTVLALTSELTDGEMTSSDQPCQEALSVAQIFVSQTSKPPKQRANANTPSPDITECNRLLWYIVYKGVPAPLFKAPTP